MIEVKGLVKKYSLNGMGFRALDDVSFKVSRGEIYGIIGLSGAGKSTLIRCLNKLEVPDYGKVIVEGQDVLLMNNKELQNYRKKTGMIFQNFNLFNQKTVYKNIAYPLEISGVSSQEIENRVEKLLDFIDLREKENEYPHNLSGGQKQRVAIARALATKPKILLSDEATSALDPTTTKSILNLIKKAVKEFDLTVIMITHQMEVAKSICNRIAVMEKGEIVEENNTLELFKNPKHHITKNFIRGNDEEINDFIHTEGKSNSKLITLYFDDETSKKAIVSNVIKKLDIEINILKGKITSLDEKPTGFLTVELKGMDSDVKKAVEMFKSNSVIVEEM